MPSRKKGEFDFTAYVETLKSAKISDDRKPEHSKPREYFLIVCEGERTEPNYFNAFKERLPKDMLDTIDIRGEGSNTIDVVEKAIEYRDGRNSSRIYRKTKAARTGSIALRHETNSLKAHTPFPFKMHRRTTLPARSSRIYR